MATVIANAHAAKSMTETLLFAGVILAMCALTGLLFSLAGPLAQRLGPAGLNVTTRVMGLLLAAIAVGMLAEGIVGLIPALGK